MKDRLEVLRDLLSQGCSLNRAAKALSLSPTGLTNWLRRHDPDLLDAFRRRHPRVAPEKVPESPAGRVVRIHDIMSFLSCRRAWDLSSPLRRNLVPLQPNKNLFLGTGIHYALQQYYSPDTFNQGILIDPVEPFKEWFVKERTQILSEVEETIELDEMFEKQYELGVGILEHYRMWAPEHDDFVVIGTELELSVPLISPSGRGFRPPIRYEGRVDKLVQDSRGKLWVAEFKTWAQIDLDRLKLEMQPSAYLWALKRQYDLDVAGVMYTILRKKVPRKPPLLVSGELSRARNIDTTYEVYLATIKEHGLNPDDYSEVLETLHEKGNTFIIREFVERTEQELNEFGERLYDITRDMFDRNLVIYPAPDPFKCRMCQYKPVCLAVAEGSDVDFVLKSQYKRRDQVDMYTLLDDVLVDILPIF